MTNLQLAKHLATGQRKQTVAKKAVTNEDGFISDEETSGKQLHEGLKQVKKFESAAMSNTVQGENENESQQGIKKLVKNVVTGVAGYEQKP
jgi:hypothetical protein